MGARASHKMPYNANDYKNSMEYKTATSWHGWWRRKWQEIQHRHKIAALRKIESKLPTLLVQAQDQKIKKGGDIDHLYFECPCDIGGRDTDELKPYMEFLSTRYGYDNAYVHVFAYPTHGSFCQFTFEKYS